MNKNKEKMLEILNNMEDEILIEKDAEIQKLKEALYDTPNQKKYLYIHNGDYLINLTDRNYSFVTQAEVDKCCHPFEYIELDKNRILEYSCVGN